MDFTLIIAVYVCGLLAMTLELFIPGAIIGTLGFFAVVGSVVYAYLNGYTTTGTVLVITTLLFLPFFFLLWKNVLGRYFAISGDEKDFSASFSITEDLIGRQGETVTRLHPSGIARIDGKRRDVVTRGEMIEKGESVRIIDTTGNRLVVEKV